MVFLHLHCTRSAGEIPGICVIYRQKRRINENITDCGVKLPWFYQLTVPAVWGYSRGLKNEVKVPDIPRGWGGGGPWLQMTSTLDVKPWYRSTSL